MASEGSIITRVYTSNAFLPLRDVPVIYTQISDTGQQELLAIRMTNSSGLTEPYFVPTPDTEQSLSPGSAIRPYALINISVSVPGYSAITAEGVQIFPGVETIQGLQLRPVPPSEHTSTATIPQSSQNL